MAVQRFADDATYQQYNADGLKKDEWQRQNIDKLIRQIGDSIQVTKPWIKFGISPFAILPVPGVSARHAWLDSVSPNQPHDAKAAPLADGVEFFWQETARLTELDKVRYYMIYRTEGVRLPRITDSRRILAVRPSEQSTRLVDRSADPKNGIPT